MGAAIVAILVCVVIAAAGRGGELARFPSDYAPPDFGAMAAVDVALLRPPTALWGYNMQATDDALSRIATAISARDVRIASLEQQVADLRASRPAPADAPERSATATPAVGGYHPVDSGQPDLRTGPKEGEGPQEGAGPQAGAQWRDDADEPPGSGEPAAAAAPRQRAADAGWPPASGTWRRDAGAADMRANASNDWPHAFTGTQSPGHALGEGEGGPGSGTGSQPLPDDQSGAGPQAPSGRDSERERGSDGTGEPQANHEPQPLTKQKAEQAAVRAQPDEEEAW